MSQENIRKLLDNLDSIEESKKVVEIQKGALAKPNAVKPSERIAQRAATAQARSAAPSAPTLGQPGTTPTTDTTDTTMLGSVAVVTAAMLDKGSSGGDIGTKVIVE